MTVMSRSTLVCALALLVLAVAITYPAIVKPSAAIYGRPSDVLATLWKIWYFGVYLKDHSAGPSKPLLNYPFGPEPSLKAGEWLSLGPTILMARIAGEVLAYNLTLILSLFLSGFFMFLLVKGWTESTAAGLISAAAFMLMPYHLAMAQYHFTLMRLEVFPLLLMALTRFEAKRGLASAILVALAFALCAYIDPHYGLFAGAIIVTYALAAYVIRPNWRMLLAYLLIAGAGALLITPLYLSAGGSLEPRPLSQLYEYAARLMAYVLPPPGQTVWAGVYWLESRAAAELAGLPRGLWHEQALFLGYLPIALALWGAWTLRRDARLAFLLGLGVLGLVLSLPPTLEVFGAKFPMPSNLLYSFLPYVRVLSRFGLLAGLAVTLLAGFGAADLLKGLRSAAARGAAGLGLVSFIVLELWGFAVGPTVEVERLPQVYSWLRGSAIEAIAEYPLYVVPEFTRAGELSLWQGYRDRLGQRVHHKPLLNGPAEGFALRLKLELRDLSDPATPARLRWLGIDAILVHEGRLSAEELKILHQSPDFELLKRFDSQGIYRVRAREIFLPADHFRSPSASFDRERKALRVRGSGLLVFGPYLALPPGEYKAIFQLKAEMDSIGKAVLSVLSGSGRISLAEREVKLSEGPARVALQFRVEDPGALDVEFRLFAEGGLSLEFRGVRLTRR